MRFALVFMLLLIPALASASPWRLDPATKVGVNVSWQGNVVDLRFPDLTGEIDFDEKDPESAQARIVVSSRSVETGIPPVSAVVRGPEFLGSERWPEIVFELDKLTLTSKSTADVAGRLTLRGVTKPVALKATVTHYGPSPDDAQRFDAGFDITGSVDRTDFGSTGGLPDVAAEIGLNIHLAMSSR